MLSHFGNGIVTWRLPYLFRTPPGINLLVRGPANSPKDGASPLEGLVETDWTAATFTMNWKLTRVGLPVVFEAGEAICMIVPQRRGELEAFEPRVEMLESDDALHARYVQWRNCRNDIMTRLREAHRSPQVSSTNEIRWQKHYLRGTDVDGTPAREHQMTLKLRPFLDLRASCPMPSVSATTATTKG